MDERPEAVPEGWSVRHRPAVIAALAVPLVFAALLIIAGWFYDRDLRPTTRQRVTPFPAPGLQTFIHDGALDPYRPGSAMKPDPAIAESKRAVARDGIVGWKRQP